MRKNAGALKTVDDDDPPYRCVHCGKGFTHGGNWKKHQNIHEGRRFHCTAEGCSGNYASQQHLDRHVRIVHTKDARLIHCPVKGCKFSTHYHHCLTYHRSVHTGERPYQCTQCDKTFSSTPHLYRHRLTHRSERRFKCSYEGCSYSTNQNPNLTRHIKGIHDSTKPRIRARPKPKSKTDLPKKRKAKAKDTSKELLEESYDDSVRRLTRAWSNSLKWPNSNL